MTSDIVNVTNFVTKDELDRAAQLAAYIAAARQESHALGITWDQSYWPGVGYFVKQTHAQRIGKKNAISSEILLDASIADFAKAYVCEQHLNNPSGSRSGHIISLQTVRMLEMAALELRGTASPLSFDNGVFDKAATLAKAYLAPNGASYVGVNIQEVANSLVAIGILPANCGQWQNPNKQRKNPGIAVGKDAEILRQKRLPNLAAIGALAEIFNRNLDVLDQRDFRDIYTTSVVALLLCAPSRGEEVHRLPYNLVFQATDKFGKDQFGLRLHASKGFGAYIKWVWSEMVPVAEKAIERLKAITEKGRELARHFENPKECLRFYRHEKCPRVGDDEPLTHVQMCEALGLSVSNPTGGLNSLLSKTSLGWSVHTTYTLQMLWDGVVLPRHRRFHPHFPYVSARDKAMGVKGGLKYSEALFCMRRLEFNARQGTNLVTLWIPSLSDFTHTVGPSASNISIFEKFSYSSHDGGTLKLTSHQIRHLLNTEAQRGGLTDEQIAHWSGRKDISQNTVYDHRTVEERVGQARAAVEKVQDNVSLVGKTASGDANISHGQWLIKVIPILRSSTEIMDIQPQMSGLKTLYGECHHDWSFAPCEGFVKCLDCSEHACIKDRSEDAKTKLARLRTLRKNVAQEVQKAKEASEDDIDAHDWLTAQERYAAKVDQLIEILESDSVPDGSVIRSAKGQHPSHLHRALRGLALKSLASSTDTNIAMRNLLNAIDRGLDGTKPELMPILENKDLKVVSDGT